MKLKKTNNIKASKKQLSTLFFVAIVGIAAWLLTMQPVADAVASVTGWDGNRVQSVASDIVRVVLTVIVVTVAILLAPVSVIGAAVVGIIGLALSVPVLYRYLKPSESISE
jgi:hypothetical protein